MSGEVVDLFDRMDEVERCLLRQVVADAAGECPVRVLARETRGVVGRFGVRRTVRVAFERDRRHADRREGREPLLEHVEFWFADCEPYPPPVVVDDHGNVVGIVERGRTALERRVVEAPRGRRGPPDEPGEVVAP